jgi:hypothetical protein
MQPNTLNRPDWRAKNSCPHEQAIPPLPELSFVALGLGPHRWNALIKGFTGTVTLSPDHRQCFRCGDGRFAYLGPIEIPSLHDWTVQHYKEGQHQKTVAEHAVHCEQTAILNKYHFEQAEAVIAVIDHLNCVEQFIDVREASRIGKLTAVLYTSKITVSDRQRLRPLEPLDAYIFEGMPLCQAFDDFLAILWMLGGRP